MTGALVVVVAGHVTHDRYGTDIVAGGSAYYTAQTHARLGGAVRLATAVGEDFACADAFVGLDAHARRAGRTTTFTNTYGDGGRIQRVVGRAPDVLAADLPAAWAACDLLHLAPVMGEIDLASWRQRVAARFVAIGVQGWIKGPADDGAVVQLPWQVEGSALAGVDAACVGEEDLRDQGDLLDRLVAAIPIVGFTHGRRGCEVIVRERTIKIGVFPTRELDPSGAGDVFSAAFFHALAGGATPEGAARLGAAAASIIIEGRGGETLARLGETRDRAGRIAAGEEISFVVT